MRVPDNDRRVRIIDKVPEIFVGLSERFLGPLAVGDVLSLGDGRDQGSLRVDNACRVPENDGFSEYMKDGYLNDLPPLPE